MDLTLVEIADGFETVLFEGNFVIVPAGDDDGFGHLGAILVLEHNVLYRYGFFYVVYYWIGLFWSYDIKR